MTAPPVDDADVAAWAAALGLDGLIDLHVHFLPDQVMAKVWAFFDQAAERYGTPWPVHYRLPQDDRVAVLRAMHVRAFAPLVYPHKPGMADWLNGWVAEFAAAVPEAVLTATLYPEPGVVEYLARALAAGAGRQLRTLSLSRHNRRHAQPSRTRQLSRRGIPAVQMPGRVHRADVGRGAASRRRS